MRYLEEAALSLEKGGVEQKREYRRNGFINERRFLDFYF